MAFGYGSLDLNLLAENRDVYFVPAAAYACRLPGDRRHGGVPWPGAEGLELAGHRQRQALAAGAAASWTPRGRPSDEVVAGTEAAGNPTRLRGGQNGM